MVQNTKAKAGSIINKVKIFYAMGIGANLLVSVVHIAYAFAAYTKIDEQAQWFFSGALAVIFNAALNLLYLREGTKLIYVTGMIVNLALLIFTILLAFIVAGAHTICVATIVFYTTVLCYCHNRQMRKNKFATGSA